LDKPILSVDKWEILAETGLSGLEQTVWKADVGNFDCERVPRVQVERPSI